MRKQTSTNWHNEKSITANCGMAYALNMLNGRWKAGILWALFENERMRFSQLRDHLEGISERMLSKQLGQLEDDELINRIAYPEVPPRVEYELTKLGRSMRPMLEKMSDWGKLHRRKVEQLES